MLDLVVAKASVVGPDGRAWNVAAGRADRGGLKLIGDTSPPTPEWFVVADPTDRRGGGLTHQVEEGTAEEVFRTVVDDIRAGRWPKDD